MTFTQGISEIVLIVRDVKISARFYHEIVGLTPEGEVNESWAWFWTGMPGQSQRIAVAKGPLAFEEHSPWPEGQRWGRVHYALTVPRETLEIAVSHLREHGLDVYGPADIKWMKSRSYYFYDPDGNLLEFWSPDV